MRRRELAGWLPAGMVRLVVSLSAPGWRLGVRSLVSRPGCGWSTGLGRSLALVSRVGSGVGCRVGWSCPRFRALRFAGGQGCRRPFIIKIKSHRLTVGSRSRGLQRFAGCMSLSRSKMLSRLSVCPYPVRVSALRVVQLAQWSVRCARLWLWLARLRLALSVASRLVARLPGNA